MCTVLLLHAAAILAAPMPQEWAGTITFFDQGLKTVGVPMNMSLSGTTATTATTSTAAATSFYFVSDYTHPDCNHDQQEGLEWSTDHTTSPPTATALGTGRDPTYYTFEGTLTAAFVWNGTVFIGSGKSAVGSFTLSPTSATNKQKPPNCRPGPPPPSPSPSPSPPVPVPDQLPVWPLPTSWTAGKGFQVLDGTQFVFRYTKPSATPKTLLQAFDR